MRRIQGLAAGDFDPGEERHESTDAFEWRVGVVGGVFGEQLYDYVVGHEAGARVSDAVCKGAATLGRVLVNLEMRRRRGEGTSMAIRMPRSGSCGVEPIMDRFILKS